MKELTHRIGRIISANLNALVDAIDNAAPNTVMEAAMQEIDAAIEEVRNQLGQAIVSRHAAVKRLSEARLRHAELAAKVEVAIAENRDDLAETAIAQQLDIEAQLPVLEAAFTQYDAEEKQLEAYIRALQARQREMSEELRQFNASEAAASGPIVINQRVEDAQALFAEASEKLTGVSASLRIQDADTTLQLAELDELARTSKVQARLAALKEGCV